MTDKKSCEWLESKEYLALCIAITDRLRRFDNKAASNEWEALDAFIRARVAEEIAAEREACAEACERLMKADSSLSGKWTAQECIAAIRARGAK